MPNPVKGVVRLSVDPGRDLKLVMDFEALVEAESAYGKPLEQLMEDAKGGFIGASRALLYGALRMFQPEITTREASEIFMSAPGAVTDALTEAIEAGFPETMGAEGKEGKNPPGRRSGRSGAKPG